MKNTPTSRLTDDLSLEPSQLYVGNFEKMLNFYQTQVGLDVLSSSKDTAVLGCNDTAAIELVSKPKLSFASPRSAGLFHNAVVYQSRGDLANTVGNLIYQAPELYSGTGDHLVSEAFYFNDPEGNGLELYFDRPKETWQWVNGQVAMDTLYIDPLQYLNSYASDTQKSTRQLGHVHLRVGDIATARAFYVDLLGFDVTADIGSALFVSVGGYHHHIGLNTWLSQGASVRAPSLGLSEVAITLSSDHDVSQLASRLETVAHPFVHSHGVLRVDDPWGNTLVFRAK